MEELVDSPCDSDVLLGRGKSHKHHPGNKAYQEIINKTYAEYFEVTTPCQKMLISQAIVEHIMEKGRFLKERREDGLWEVIPVEIARQKAAHALQYRQRQANHKNGDTKPINVIKEEKSDKKIKKKTRYTCNSVKGDSIHRSQRNAKEPISRSLNTSCYEGPLDNCKHQTPILTYSSIVSEDSMKDFESFQDLEAFLSAPFKAIQAPDFDLDLEPLPVKNGKDETQSSVPQSLFEICAICPDLRSLLPSPVPSDDEEEEDDNDIEDVIYL